MDFFKRRNSTPDPRIPDLNPSNSHPRTGNENTPPSRKAVAARSYKLPSKSKKKILVERNHVGDHFDGSTQITPLQSRSRSPSHSKSITSSTPDHAPYDPVTNYLSPRPRFLLYNPEHRREILRRIEGDDEDQESTERGSDEDDDGFDEDDDDEEESPGWSTMVFKLVLLLGVLVSLTCYISTMNSAPVPSLEACGGVLGNHCLGWIPRRGGNASMFSGDMVDSLAGPLDKCLIVCLRETASQDEDIESKMLISGDLIKRGELEWKELLDERLDYVVGDSRTGDDGSKTCLLIDDKLSERVDLEEDIAFVNGRLHANGLSAEEKNEEVVDSHEFIVDEQFTRTNTSFVEDEGSEKEDTERSVTVEGDAPSVDDSLQASRADLGLQSKPLSSVETQTSSIEEIQGPGCAEVTESLRVPAFDIFSSTPPDAFTAELPIFQDVQLDLSGTLETQTSLRAETQGTGSVEVTESSHVSQPQMVLNTSTDDETTERPKLSTVSDTEVKWGLSWLWICSLISILGFLSSLYKYFHRTHQSAFPVAPSCPEPAVEENSMVSDHSSDEYKDLYASRPLVLDSERSVADDLRSSVSLDHLNDEHDELYASRPPIVELLGEFSVISETGSGQKTESKGAESLQFSQSERRSSTRKKLSPSPTAQYPSSSPESVSNGTFSTQQKPLGKEQDRGNREATTPLRRSSRIRSRATS